MKNVSQLFSLLQHFFFLSTNQTLLNIVFLYLFGFFLLARPTTDHKILMLETCCSFHCKSQAMKSSWQRDFPLSTLSFRAHFFWWFFIALALPSYGRHTYYEEMKKNPFLDIRLSIKSSNFNLTCCSHEFRLSPLVVI